MAPLRKTLLLVSLFLIIITIGSAYAGYVGQLQAGLPLEPTIVTDKEQYRIGETIHATFRYTNPNLFSVPFTPPSKVFSQLRKWPDSTAPKDIPVSELPGSIEPRWGTVNWVVIGPNEGFDGITC